MAYLRQPPPPMFIRMNILILFHESVNLFSFHNVRIFGTINRNHFRTIQGFVLVL